MKTDIIADKGRREWAHAVRVMARPSVGGSFLQLALKAQGASRALQMAGQSIVPAMAHQQCLGSS